MKRKNVFSFILCFLILGNVKADVTVSDLIFRSKVLTAEIEQTLTNLSSKEEIKIAKEQIKEEQRVIDRIREATLLGAEIAWTLISDFDFSMEETLVFLNEQLDLMEQNLE